MIARLLFAPLVLAAGALGAQAPVPDPDNPRIQRVAPVAGSPIELTVPPRGMTTLVFETGERIVRVEIDRPEAFAIAVAEYGDALSLTALDPAASAMLTLTSDRTVYEVSVQAQDTLLAAYVVRVVPSVPTAALASAASVPIDPGGSIWRYRLRGDRSVRPSRLWDDGARTVVEFGEDQALPAIFAIGPTGNEEVVNGYMRDGRFVIDRVYEELVFRIDKDRARARRADEPEAADG